MVISMSSKRDCGVSSVMVARAAEWNPSVFRKDGKLDVHDVIKEYLKYVRNVIF